MRSILFVDHDSMNTGSTVSLEFILKYFVKKNVKVFLLTEKSNSWKKYYSDLGVNFISVESLPGNLLFLDLHFLSQPYDISLISVKRLIHFILSFSFGIIVGIWKFYLLKPDLIYINEYVSVHLGVAAKICRLPVVMHVRSLFTNSRFSLRGLFLKMVSSRVCDEIIAITEIESKQFNYNEKFKIHVIGEFVGIEEGPFFSNTNLLKEKFGLPKDPQIICMIGGLIRFKGAYEFIAAANIVLESYPTTIFVIAGSKDSDMGYVELCEKEIVKHDFGRNVFLLHEVHNILELISVSEILVSANLFSHFSRPIIESWSLKKPVIATDTLHSRKLVEHNVDGIIVKTGDVMELANAMGNLLVNEISRCQYGENGFQKAKKCFSAENNIEKIYQLCRQHFKNCPELES